MPRWQAAHRQEATTVASSKTPAFIAEAMDPREAAVALATRADAASDQDIAGLVAMGQSLASLDAGLAALEAVGTLLSVQRLELVGKKIPDRMAELKLPSIGLQDVTRERWLKDGAKVLHAAAAMLEDPPEALLDAIKVPEDPVLSVEPYVRANIAADWEEERREAAFQCLEDRKAGGMIKVVLRASFGTGDKKLFDRAVKAFKKSLGKRVGDVGIEVNKSVPHGTLTAYVKSELEQEHEVPLLTLGATAGMVAKLGRQKRRGK